MKKFIFTLLALISASICFAQVKTTYCDVYVRGSWHTQTITIMHNNQILYQMQGNISEALNQMSSQGWELVESIVIPRAGFPVTRHKLHFIMKKEYTSEVNSPKMQINSEASNKSNNVNIAPEITSDHQQIVEMLNSSSQSLMDKFATNGDDIAKLNKTIRAKTEKEFCNEILVDIKNATTKEDINNIKKKVDVLTDYNHKISDSNLVLTSDLSSINIKLVAKAKKLGITF